MGLFTAKSTNKQMVVNSPEITCVAIPSTWPSRLDVQISALKNLTSNTEEQFLTLGAEFHHFHAKAAEVLESIQRMVAGIAGDGSFSASSQLHTLLQRMEAFLRITSQETTRISDSFTRILDLFAAVEEPLSNFRKINKILRVLSTSTKIESARMGSGAAGFETLANDVATMSVHVLEKAGRVIALKGELSTTMQTALKQISGTEIHLSHRVGETLDRTRRDIELLDAVYSRCSEAAELVEGSSVNLADDLSQVVMSMQAHDITRQQIEHVYEAIAELLAHYNNCITGDDTRQAIQETGDICELQAAQLRYASSEFRSSVLTIISKLEQVVDGAAGLSSQISALTGVAGQTGSSFLVEMEGALLFVNKTLAESANLNQELSRIMEGVSTKVGEIEGFVREIGHIGDEIELIALNSQIKSARAGMEGAALGVLAEAIQRLSADTSELTSGASASLLQITEATELLCSGVDAETMHVLHDIEEISADVQALMTNLRTMNSSLIEQSTIMNLGVSELGSDISRAISTITVHDVICREAEQVAEVLDSVVTEARSIVPSAIGGSASERLSKIADRYTMHSERLVHAQVSQESATQKLHAAHVPNAPSAAVDDGFGDNVELF